MGKPIGQTFYVSEPPPPNGVDGIFVTAIGVYFKQVSAVQGIEMQIRKTQNGLPTSLRMPFATKYLPAANCTASNTAATETRFYFDTPVFLPANDLYAIVLMPAGGNPDYLVWTGTISDTDVTTNTPIYTNASVGDMFLSSNDLSWQPVYTEDMKFNIYNANFTSLSGHAYFKSPSEEWIKYSEPVGNFIPRETVYFGNTPIQTVQFSVASTNGTFNVGDTVYQGNSLFVATGIVTSANSTVIKVKNANGAFINSTAVSPNAVLISANSGANCIANIVYQYVNTTSGSNTVGVPDSAQFTASNTMFYVQTNNRSNVQIVLCTSIVNSTAITVNSQISFTDTAAIIGRLIANGAMYGGYSGGAKLPTSRYYNMVLDRSTANSTVNLANASFSNCQIIGNKSGASAWLRNVNSPLYDTVTPHFHAQAYTNTSINWYLQGIQEVTYLKDANASIQLINEQINELTDIRRIDMSRSNELSLISGNSSFIIDAALTTQNALVSPVIDNIRSTATLTANKLVPEWKLTGYKLAYKITSANSTMTVGDTLTMNNAWGNTATGSIISISNNIVIVANVVGKFIGSNTSFTGLSGLTGYITNANRYSESSSNSVLGLASRYISKNVILAANQDSEDMIVYITAYRPPNTNFLVYSRIINAADSDTPTSKRWSKMPEITIPQLYSSTGNIDDQNEIQYGFPTSQLIYSSNTQCNTSSANVTVTSTQYISPGNCIYFKDSANGFNVRRVIYVTNTTSLVVERYPSFVSGNANLGLIPGMDHSEGAFLYDQANNIVRYQTSTDAIFERYIQFALKIVPVGDNTLIVPRAADVRALCLQV